MLGLRSIRYSLQNLDMFKVQLRAFLRASLEGDVRLMFPLIISLMEFRQAKLTLHDAMEDLEEDGIPFRRDFPVGMMLETPAAAVQVIEFCRDRLAGYKVPRQVEFRDGLPRNAAGKVLKNVLTGEAANRFVED